MTPESRTGDPLRVAQGTPEGHTGARARRKGYREVQREVQRRTERARAGKVKGKE